MTAIPHVRYRARWIVPIVGAPVRDGWIDVAGDRIVAVGGPATGKSASAPHRTEAAFREIDLGDVALLPGLVNAHTHLELSALRGRVRPASSMAAWVRDLLRQRAAGGAVDPAAVDRAVQEAHRAGTVLVGDITNTLATVAPLSKSALFARVFFELLRITATDAQALVDDAVARLRAIAWSERVRPALAAHAPYSVAPALLAAVAKAAKTFDGGVTSIHVAESPEELEFLARGTGPWRKLLEDLGAWDGTWQPPGTGPVAYLRAAGWFTGPTLVVHGVHLTDQELASLAAVKAVVVACPRSNLWTGAGAPPVERFYRAGLRVAVGTDSLASVDDLNLFAELAALRRLAPTVPARRLLESATLIGAEALGFGDELGSLLPGRRAAVVAVRVPREIVDVEEYLVSGIDPAQLAWVHS